MSLLFNMLSRLVIIFLPRGKRLLISLACNLLPKVAAGKQIGLCWIHRPIWRKLTTLSNPSIHECGTCMPSCFSHVQLLVTLWTVAHQAPLSMGFSRQEYWSGLPFPSLEDLPNPGTEPRFPTLQSDSLLSEPPGKPQSSIRVVSNIMIVLLFTAK